MLAGRQLAALNLPTHCPWMGKLSLNGQTACAFSTLIEKVASWASRAMDSTRPLQHGHSAADVWGILVLNSTHKPSLHSPTEKG